MKREADDRHGTEGDEEVQRHREPKVPKEEKIKKSDRKDKEASKAAKEKAREEKRERKEREAAMKEEERHSLSRAMEGDDRAHRRSVSPRHLDDRGINSYYSDILMIEV